MKKLIAAVLFLTAVSARAGTYYDNQQTASSDTLRVGGVIKVADPSSPFAPTITLNGVGGVCTATSFVGALTGQASSVASSGVDLSTVTTALALKLDKAGGTMTGPLVLTTAGNMYLGAGGSYSGAVPSGQFIRSYPGDSVIPLSTDKTDLVLGESDGVTFSTYAHISGGGDGSFVTGQFTAASYLGDGSGLSGVLPLTGGTLTGQLTTTSTITVQGSAFSVGGSTFVVAGGIISEPSQPAGFFYEASGSQIVPTGTNTDIYFGTSEYSENISYDATSSSETMTVVAGGDGTYAIHCHPVFQSNSTGYRLAAILVNGTLRARCVHQAVNGGETGFDCPREIKLSAGDTVKCQVQQNSGGDLTLSSDANGALTFGYIRKVR